MDNKEHNLKYKFSCNLKCVLFIFYGLYIFFQAQTSCDQSSQCPPKFWWHALWLTWTACNSSSNVSMCFFFEKKKSSLHTCAHVLTSGRQTPLCLSDFLSVTQNAHTARSGRTEVTQISSFGFWDTCRCQSNGLCNITG